MGGLAVSLGRLAPLQDAPAAPAWPKSVVLKVFAVDAELWLERPALDCYVTLWQAGLWCVRLIISLGLSLRAVTCVHSS